MPGAPDVDEMEELCTILVRESESYDPWTVCCAAGFLINRTVWHNKRWDYEDKAKMLKQLGEELLKCLKDTQEHFDKHGTLSTRTTQEHH